MDSNLFQLTSSTLLKKVKVSAGQLRLGNDTFPAICGTLLFLEKPDVQCNLGHMSYLFNMQTKEQVQELTTEKVIEKCLGLFEIKGHYER